MLCAFRQSTTPTQSLIGHAIFGLAEPPRGLAWPLTEIFTVSVFPKDTKKNCSVLEPNRESTILRLPTYHLIHWVRSPLVEKLALSVFPKNTTTRYAQCNFTIILFGALTD